MKYLIYYLLALCLIFLLELTNEHSKQIKELREGHRLLRQENEQLQADLTAHKAEIKDMVRPYSHIIPIDGGYLGLREGCDSLLLQTALPYWWGE